MAEAINDQSPAAQHMLGEIWMLRRVRALRGARGRGPAREWGNGMWFPDGPPLPALRAMLPLWFPRVNEIIKLLGSHNLLATPTWRRCRIRSCGRFIDKYLHGAKDTDAGTAHPHLPSGLGFRRHRARFAGGTV